MMGYIKQYNLKQVQRLWEFLIQGENMSIIASAEEFGH